MRAVTTIKLHVNTLWGRNTLLANYCVVFLLPNKYTFMCIWQTYPDLQALANKIWASLWSFKFCDVFIRPNARTAMLLLNIKPQCCVPLKCMCSAGLISILPYPNSCVHLLLFNADHLLLPTCMLVSPLLVEPSRHTFVSFSVQFSPLTQETSLRLPELYCLLIDCWLSFQQS